MGQVWKGPEHGRVCPRGAGVCRAPPSWQVDTFTSPEALQTPSRRVSLQVPGQGTADRLAGCWELTQPPAPPPAPDVGMGLRVSLSHHVVGSSDRQPPS